VDADRGTPVAIAKGDERRMERQFRQLVDYTQKLVRDSDAERKRFFEGHDPVFYRNYYHDEILGRLKVELLPLGARTRQIYDRPAFTGYEVQIPMTADLFAYGVLLVPKNLKKGERRPLVVTQHGLNSRAQDTVEGADAKQFGFYQNYAARLAARGYVVYSPQNPYIFEERFRVLLRKGNPVKLSLFSFIVAQHGRALDWLETLEFVDRERIGFYGLSYGGKTAMRVPPLEPRYKVVICSGDFNEWIWKITSVDQPFSYMFSHEYDMLEFDTGSTYNYFELAKLIAPRPFMVERGHYDQVGTDEWIAYEFAKVRRYYAGLSLPENAALEFFKGPHQIWGQGTFEFLDRHLHWP
jgi:cephalosporin-C deacetylase-like acetyl esterase